MRKSTKQFTKMYPLPICSHSVPHYFFLQSFYILQKREETAQKRINSSGFGLVYRIAKGTHVIEEMDKLAAQILQRSVPVLSSFMGKLVFEGEKWYQRIIHNETAYAIQRKLQFGVMNCMVLPVLAFANQKL